MVSREAYVVEITSHTLHRVLYMFCAVYEANIPGYMGRRRRLNMAFNIHRYTLNTVISTIAGQRINLVQQLIRVEFCDKIVHLQRINKDKLTWGTSFVRGRSVWLFRWLGASSLSLIVVIFHHVLLMSRFSSDLPLFCSFKECTFDSLW